jgi:transposase
VAVTDGHGLPLAIHVASASPHETALVEATLASAFAGVAPRRLLADRAYDSDPLDRRLAERYGIELIAPHRRNRTKPRTQDGRKLRRYRRRWKIERFFAWLLGYRRIAVRWDRHVENYLGFVQLACLMILLNHF